MVKWKLVYTKQAQKDAKKLGSARLKSKAKEILKILEKDPFQVPPPYEKLFGDLSGAHSRRINIQHRIVYQILNEEKTVKIIRTYKSTEDVHAMLITALEKERKEIYEKGYPFTDISEITELSEEELSKLKSAL